MLVLKGTNTTCNLHNLRGKGRCSLANKSTRELKNYLLKASPEKVHVGYDWARSALTEAKPAGPFSCDNAHRTSAPQFLKALKATPG